MDAFFSFLDSVNDVIWHDSVLYVVLAVGILFTVWSGFSQYRALTHGVQVLRGTYDDPDDPGAINHFQALSAALSATVGLGNIGGVAVAVGLGGPGAVFWMWVIGFFGMALKLTEVAQSMIYRDTTNPQEPHGGPMYVVSRGLEEWGFGTLGKLIGGAFCITLLVSAITGGNMFQAWNVGIVTEQALPIPAEGAGILLAVIVGAVILGGIKRIGAVAGRLVPAMVALYLLAAGYVLLMNFTAIPEAFRLIFTHAFSPSDAQGAFLGGTAGYAFLWGMKRALFSSEAGQGSAPIAHAAARSGEPVREAVVAGLEPFIDTLVVCTITSLVIIVTGAWNRSGEAVYEEPPAFTQMEDGAWQLPASVLPPRTEEAKDIAMGHWTGRERVFVVAEVATVDDDTGTNQVRVNGKLSEDAGVISVVWKPVSSSTLPELVDGQVFVDYPGAALTTYAINRVTPGLGTWIILLASWLFAVSTMISWSYYGEQGIIFLFGERGVIPYKIFYCLLIVVATTPLIQTDAQLDAFTALGTGVMLWANIPIMLLFGKKAMDAYHEYFRKLKAGEFHPHGPHRVVDIVEGRD